MRKTKIILFFVFAILIISSCDKNVKHSQSIYWQGKDYYGRQVTLTKEPRRIVSFSPCLTEILFSLNSENRLVGISDFCTYPSGTDTIPHIGDLLNINVEAVCALQPDLILAGSIVAKEVVEQFEKSGIPVLIIKAEQSVEDIYEATKNIGEIVGKKELAEKQNEEMREKILRISVESSKMKRNKKVYYVVGFGDAGDFTAPGNTHIDEIISLAGGINVGADLTSWQISREYLFQQNPDLIFIRKEDYEKFISTSPYDQLNAVKNKNTYPIESGWIDIVSQRNILAIDLIAEKCSELQ